MGIDRLLGDEVFIQSPSGETIGPVRSSVQRNKVYISDETLVIEEGGKILRPLPNGKAEFLSILEVHFHRDPSGGRLSHYEITTRKDSSLVPAPSATTINISHSHGIQIGDGDIQSIVGSFEVLVRAIECADVPASQKEDARSKLKAFLTHPLTTAVLGVAASKLIGML